jgi:hypothetical protein
MPKSLKLKVTKIGHYGPTSKEYKDGDCSELHLPLVCSDIKHGNKKVVFDVYGIDARMWVAKNPDEMDISSIEYLITDIVKHGKTYNEGWDLWRIHTKYPFHIPIIRNFFSDQDIWTGMGDIPYERAFPIHYGMKSRYISVKKLNKVMNISDIVML